VPATQTWLKGNKYGAGATSPKVASGERIPTARGASLVNSQGAFVTVVPPTYQEFTNDQVVNVKEHSVSGDGIRDDTAAIQAVINSAAAKGQLVFFPYGTYVITDTVKVPKGSRLVGEAWSQFMASGAKFQDIKRPRPMIQVGAPGDVGMYFELEMGIFSCLTCFLPTGLAQMSDFILGIKSASPGLVLLEINMAGTKPGDVGFFNVHFPLNMGGAITKGGACTSASNCPSNHISVHMTPSSSVYWENTWVSDAGGFQSRTSNGGGFFVESQGGTWINGVGSGQSLPPEANRYPIRESSYWRV
jgi:glucan 1,3-beta-glucosidase